MKTRAQACCSRQTFATESEARRRLDRIVALGVSRVLPRSTARIWGRRRRDGAARPSGARVPDRGE